MIPCKIEMYVHLLDGTAVNCFFSKSVMYAQTLWLFFFNVRTVHLFRLNISRREQDQIPAHHPESLVFVLGARAEGPAFLGHLCACLKCCDFAPNAMGTGRGCRGLVLHASSTWVPN